MHGPDAGAFNVEGFAAGRSFAERSGADLAALAAAVANPTMGRGLWAAARLAALSEELPPAARGDLGRFAGAAAAALTAARRDGPDSRGAGRHLAAAVSAADQVEAFARAGGAGDAPRPPGITDAEATEYARGFLEAVASYVGDDLG